MSDKCSCGVTPGQEALHLPYCEWHKLNEVSRLRTLNALLMREHEAARRPDFPAGVVAWSKFAQAHAEVEKHLAREKVMREVERTQPPTEALRRVKAGVWREAAKMSPRDDQNYETVQDYLDDLAEQFEEKAAALLDRAGEGG